MLTRLQDRVEDTMRGVLKVRAAPDDIVEWSATVGPLVIEHDDDESCTQVVVTLWLSLGDPESTTRRMGHVLIPVVHADPASLVSWANRLWDSLEFSRMSATLEVEES